MSRKITVALTVLILGASIASLLGQRTAAAQPQLEIYKIADKSVVTPGDTITYTIFIKNFGPQKSPIVWVNDTLPLGVSYVNDTAYLIYSASTAYFQYSILTGDTLRTKFTAMDAGNFSYAIVVNVAATVTDGQVLRNTARLNYTNTGFKVQEELNWTASTNVSTPVMHLTNTFQQNLSDPSLANFTLEVSNTGSIASQRVWLNDSLPQGIDYVSYQAPPSFLCSQVVAGAVNCTRDNFGPGVETIVLHARITPFSTPGTTLMDWAFLNSTNQDGSNLPQIKASASFFTQTAVINPSKMVDQNRALPGSRIHYFIYLNNTGALVAPDVWINDTLPTGVSVTDASPTPTVNTSGRVEWHLTDVAPGSHAVNIEVSLGSTLANGTVLTNQVTVDYFDEIGRKFPRSTRGVSTTVSFDIPLVRIVKTANVATVKPGGQVIYTIFYNNTGSTDAQTLTVDDEMPIGVSILSSDPAFTSIAGSHYIWQFTNVPLGVHVITITIRVDASLAEGASIVNTATVSYTDRYGQVVGTNFMSVVVEVRAVAPNGEKDLPVWLWPTIILVLIVGITIALWYYNRRRGEEAVIDDVFLLHKDGLLIRHFTRKLNPKIDSDILGGMLIAVQNFVNESFASDKGLAKEDGLDQLKFGKYSILLARGKYVVVAAVVSGDRTSGKVGEIAAAIKDIEKDLGATLDRWSGDMGQVKGADKHIQDLMAGKFKKKGRTSE